MAERYATVIKDNEGREVISNISLFEGKPSDPSGDNAKYVKVGDGVKIGMIKGGKGEASDGFGFENGTETASAPAAEEPKAPKRAKKADAKASEPAGGEDANADAGNTQE